MADSKKTKTQLEAEIEAMRERMHALEKRPGKERRNNYMLRIFIDALPHFAFAFDRDGRILQVLTGGTYSESQVLEGKLLSDVAPRGDAEELEGALRRTLETGKPQRFDFIMSVMAGRRWYRVKSSLVKEPPRRNPFAVFLFQDITNEKLAEGVLQYAQIELEEKSAALEESGKRFSNLIDTSLQGIYVHDGQRLVHVNHIFAEMLGYETPGEVLEIGDALHFCAPAERERIGQYIGAHFSDGAPLTRYEYLGLRKDGSTLWLENLVQVVNWNGGNAILVTVLDIDERKRTEEELRAGERLVHTVFDSIPHALFVRDREGRYLMVNEILANRYGVTPADFAGKRLDEVVADFGVTRDWRGYLESDRAVFESGERISLPDREIKFSDGSRLAVHTVKSPLRDGSGGVVGVVGVTEDITERKLMEKRLREGQKMEAVGQLAGGIAHDFNNLLQVIINYARFARSNLDDKEAMPDWLDKIVRAGDRATALIRQMLAFSRNSELQKQAVDLNELTTQFLHMVGRVIGADIELSFLPDSDLHPVLVDRGMMEQVILNLCVNARDAMPDGGKLEIRTGNFLADSEFCRIHDWEHTGDYVSISVRDNGVGMTQEVSEHIFEPFFTTKDVGQGTGLGLAMVHGIVEQHQGKISVFSEPGTGTTIQINLPRSDQAMGEQVDSPAVEAAGGSECVLVVEDEESVRALLADMLESKGYRVISAIDGQEAIERIESGTGSIDLVILDVVMPRVKGRQVYEYIQKTNPGLAVIFSTGYSESVLDPNFLASNDLKLIQKPYSPTQLFETVREVLDKRGQIA